MHMQVKQASKRRPARTEPTACYKTLQNINSITK